MLDEYSSRKISLVPRSVHLFESTAKPKPPLQQFKQDFYRLIAIAICKLTAKFLYIATKL
jgi:hypothetical protein